MSKITINDIARLANTSKTTVSFYLNNKFEAMSEETRKRIKKVIAETNYTPNLVARSLSISKTNLLGVIIGDITNAFSNQLVKGIEDCANEYNYQIIIGNSNYAHARERKYIDNLLQLGVDGFIVQPTTYFTPLIEKIKDKNKKLIFIDSNIENDEIMSVKSDNYNSVYHCMKEIISHHNYDKYIIIGGNPLDLSTRKERAKGFADSLRQNNLEYESIIVNNNAKAEEVRRKMLPKISAHFKTLFFVPNCWLLPVVYGILDYYKQKIPDEIGIVGFDNTEWCQFVSPKITTIVQPAYKEGYTVVKRLIDMIETENIRNEKITMMCNVSWQESVKL